MLWYNSNELYMINGISIVCSQTDNKIKQGF